MGGLLDLPDPVLEAVVAAVERRTLGFRGLRLVCKGMRAAANAQTHHVSKAGARNTAGTAVCAAVAAKLAAWPML